MTMDQPVEALLFPYVTTPPRIALDLVDALAACPAVSRVVLFGSVAEDRHDGWSDVDALCAVEGEDGPWQAAAVLRHAMPMRWHGRFSSAAPPSGRHWLLGESVFHSVDLSYGSAEEIARRIAELPREFEVVTDVRLDRVGVASDGRPVVDVLSEDYDFTHALHAALKAMKAYLRAAGTWDQAAERMKALEAAARGLAHRPAGSDPDDVMNETRTLYYALMQERMRYGGDE
ncbi:MAG: nucleotidyltransferase domain-containing protein [Dehalococcoidia bacterium]|nr:nucleotidyltransferase domain-containing protein [Dehalococcoidia bacterium]